MDNEQLLEIKKNLAFLPVLKERISVLENKIRDAEGKVEKLLDKYRKESLDVEKLEKNTLSTILLKNFGKYEDKLDKESEEMLAAKLEYDKAVVRLKELKSEKLDSEKRLSLLQQDSRRFEEELKNREALVRMNINSEAYGRYSALEAEQDALSRQLVETGEAISAGKRAMATAQSAIEHLETAEGWATFDVWSRGGIISHIAKYNQIDDASYECNRLNSQLEDLKQELMDINISGVTGFDGIDSGTRAIDFWFDNIFTDMSVRERIRDDNDRVTGLRDKISGIIYRLDNSVSDIKRRLAELEQQKRNLLINTTL